MGVEAEVFRHAADAHSIFGDASAERHGQELAAEIIAPLVINAGEILRIAAVRAADHGAAMRALIDRGTQGAVQRASHYDASVADVGGFEIARIRQLGLKADIIPR